MIPFRTQDVIHGVGDLRKIFLETNRTSSVARVQQFGLKGCEFNPHIWHSNLAPGGFFTLLTYTQGEFSRAHSGRSVPLGWGKGSIHGKDTSFGGFSDL